MNNNDDQNRDNDYMNIRRPDDNLGDCKICLDKISFSDYYVTEYCGHVYCKDCITSLIKNSSQEANFPIRCIQENCNAELVIKDFQNLITNEDDFQAIVEASFKHFQSQNSDKYFCCPSPDCPTIIRKVQEPTSALELKEFICGVCQHSVCMSCGNIYHKGTKCAYNAADETLRSWIDEDELNRSICPKCSFGIEKNGGCNHMTCSNCKTHICWVCKMIFDASGPCYDHMRQVHGGIGA
ncbi:hypothetical protein HELRODRAFT_113569 [Helobdella robusta]|uniref:Uncharacterized protein n=1 Tax=Helobdella robusta TaxID=6412 RepID=T1EFT8_HELRO|nr:hypothetical protein HELRODRAFT_113569 [Helobdella robusta]ESN99805.1 hypothetical protein HELRODRAFT_113569 [Helobdella robusta]